MFSLLLDYFVWIMKFLFLLLLFLTIVNYVIVNDIYFHSYYIYFQIFLKINHRCLEEVIKQLLFIMIFIIMNLKFK